MLTKFFYEGEYGKRGDAFVFIKGEYKRAYRIYVQNQGGNFNYREKSAGDMRKELCRNYEKQNRL